MQIKDITELIKRLKLNKELDKNKIILIVALCLILIYLDISFIIRAQARGISALQPKIIKLNTDINDLAKGLAAIKEFTQEKALAVRKGEPEAAKKIIQEEELPLLLQEITDTANGTSTKIMQIKPIKDPKAKEEIVAGVKVMPLMIALDLSCGYHSLGSFISTLENSKKFMLTQEIKILTNPENYLCQNVALTIKTYVKK
ncbi:MAG: type 4a pilus biogenesis protein PilO [Candidatus Omnitrophota bacterium]